MSNRVVGRIAAIYRYPVKSMALEALDSIDVGWNGLAADRRWAFVRDSMVRNGFPWMTIRERSDMWHYVPRLIEPEKPDTSETVVRTPAGDELDVTDPALAAELGEGVRVIRQSRGIFDTFPISLISARSVDAIAHLSGAPIDVCRFRPNFFVESVDDIDFIEDQWVGSVLQIGALQMRVDKRDKRCVVVTVDPDTTERDPSVLRVIAQERQACLGVYGTTVEPGVVSIGDTVSVVS